jgi:dUTP pyrophosphatase
MNGLPKIKFSRLRPEQDQDLPLPCYMTTHASGMDIHAGIKDELTLNPMAIKLIPTGFAMEIPPGYEAQIRPRSGLAIKHGIGVINSPGTIDSDYRGEIKVALINFGSEPYQIKRGDRICQMVIAGVIRASIETAAELNKTERNQGGFGHTGLR